jgi:iron-sulfur cluster assembly protein
MSEITMSERAKKEIFKLIEEKRLPPKTAGLRFGIKGGGCSGFMYECSMAGKADKFDEVFEFKLEDARRKLLLVNSKIVNTKSSESNPTIKVFVDKKSLIFVELIHIDYKRALMGAGFQFSNPSSPGTCGCGESFAV